MTIYDRILDLANMRGVSIRSVENSCGLSHGCLRRWTNRQPSADRVKRVADYFGVSVNYLLGVPEYEEYYIDPEVSYMAQQLKDRPELKVLFDASKSMTKSDIEFVIAMIEKMRK